MKKGIVEVLQTEMLDFSAPVIINNLPSIDGLLCSQRQVIWGMKKANMTSDKQFYKMLKASGRIFDYYILGDMPLCGVMKNMGNNYVLHKYLMPKGSFGNKNLRDGVGSAPRYIECKLDKYSEYMIEGTNQSAVPMKNNYDATELEPVILPSKIPNILTNLRMSIAVSEANSMPSHNLNEVCDGIISYIKTNDIDKSIDIIKCPDLPSGGSIPYDKELFTTIYKTGRGSFPIIGKYRYDEKRHSIIIYEIPYSTYIENIDDDIEKNIDKFKGEIVRHHNGSDKDGLKLEVFLKKNADVDTVVQKLRQYTSFEKTFSCNFTILDLDNKTPQLMSLEAIITKWLTHRINCIQNEISHKINKNKTELNKLYGLKTIINNLDKAIAIIRNSQTTKIAIEELIKYFKLNDEQAEYIAEIKLVNINDDWIKNKISNIEILENNNKQLDIYYNNKEQINNTIIADLEDVKKLFGKPRLTNIIYNDVINTITQEDLITDNSISFVLTKQNYLKKNLKFTNNESQKIKDDDIILQNFTTTNKTDLLLFTNKNKVLIRKSYDIAECVPSALGEYLPNFLKGYIEEDETIIYITTTKDYKGTLCTLYENGQISKTPLSSFTTKQNRLVPQDAYTNENGKLIDLKILTDDCDILMISNEGKALITNSSQINEKKSRKNNGSKGINLKDGNIVIGGLIGYNDNLKFIITTEKGKTREYLIDDIADNSDKSWTDYLKGNRGREGNFIWNSRQKKDKIIEVRFE